MINRLLILLTVLVTLSCDDSNETELTMIRDVWDNKKQGKIYMLNSDFDKIVNQFKNDYVVENQDELKAICWYKVNVNKQEYKLILFHGAEVRHLKVILVLKGDKEIGYFDYNPNSPVSIEDYRLFSSNNDD